MGGSFARFAEATLAPLWNLLARIYLFMVFYKSAILKVSDLLNGHADRVIFLFEYEYKLPIPSLIGPIASFAELACAFLVLIGLFSRISAFLLLCMAVFIQFWYLQHVSHILWMFLSSYIVIYGGGRLSVDAIWCKTVGSMKYSGAGSKASAAMQRGTDTVATAVKKPMAKAAKKPSSSRKKPVAKKSAKKSGKK